MYLMIDNYDSFTYNLYALFSQQGAEVTIIKNDEFIPPDNYRGIILSPGPSRPENSGTTLRYLKEYIAKKPIFGVCLGMQAIAYSIGYPIVQADTIQHGKLDTIRVTGDSLLFQGVPESFKAVRYHSLAVKDPGAVVTSRSESDNTVMSIEDKEKMIFGVQFHPESILSEYGGRMVSNFLKFAEGVSAEKKRTKK